MAKKNTSRRKTQQTWVTIKTMCQKCKAVDTHEVSMPVPLPPLDQKMLFKTVCSADGCGHTDEHAMTIAQVQACARKLAEANGEHGGEA